MSKPQQPWTRAEKRLLGSVFGILALAAGVAVACGYLRPVRDLVVPGPTMPHPNAFDYDRAAGNGMRNSPQVERAYFNSVAGGPLAPATHLIRENKAALKALRQGLSFPYQSPPMRSINDKAPYWFRERDVARLLALEGQVKAAHGDWNGAVQSDLDAIQLGEQIPHGAVLIGGLVGFACQAIGRHPLWTAVDHLNSMQAKSACRRLEQIQASAVPFADTLQEEEWFGQAAMLEQFRRGLRQIPDPVQSIILRHYTQYMDESIANARLAYARKPPPPDPPKDPVNAIFVPFLDKARIKDVDNQTQNAMLIVRLALRAYQVDHHVYPVSLDLLSQVYLSRLTHDPFALAGSLRYKCFGPRFVLYSVGPDGRNDGGRPICAPAKGNGPGAQRARYFVQDDSTGDVVAGVNM